MNTTIVIRPDNMPNETYDFSVTNGVKIWHLQLRAALDVDAARKYIANYVRINRLEFYHGTK